MSYFISYEQFRLDGNTDFVFDNSPVQGYTLTTTGNGTASWTQSSVIEYADYSSLPATGLGSRIYITLNNNNSYRWDGASYQPVTGLLLTTNIVYVSKSGNDSTGARHDIGKPFLTIESAVSVAQSGDTIVVLPGSYSVTTTGTNGIAKDGVDYYMYPNVIINKSTSGPIFKSGNSLGTNVTGFGRFEARSSAGYVYDANTTARTNYFQAVSAHSSAGDLFRMAPGASMEFDVKVASSSAGRCVLMDFSNNGASLVIRGLYWYSTYTSVLSGGWWYYCSLNINVVAMYTTSSAAVIDSVNAGNNIYIRANSLTSNGSVSISHGDGTSTFNISCDYMTGYSGLGRVVFNGRCKNLIFNGFFWSGGEINYLSNSGQEVQNVRMKIWDTVSSQLYVSGGQVEVWIGLTSYGFIFDITGGRVILNGVFVSNQISHVSPRRVQGGELIINGRYEHGGAPDYFNYPAVVVTGGTLRLKACTLVNGFANLYAHGIEWSGGKVIIDGAMMKISHTEAFPIRATVAGLQLKVLAGGLTTNSSTYALLDGKYHISTVSHVNGAAGAAVNISIDINAGSGWVTFTLAAGSYPDAETQMIDFVGVINANVSFPATAVHNTGTSTLTLTGDNYGVILTFQNQFGASGANVRQNSYPMTEIVGGTILVDSDAE